MTKRTAFIIAGFELNRTAAHSQYGLLRKAIEIKGYRVVPVDINWKYRTISRFAAEFKELYLQKAGTHNIIIGNSFGAMVAMITASELKPDKIILCSLSPFFVEDTPRFKPDKLENWFGVRRVKDFNTISAKSLAKQINQANIPIVLLYGEYEKKIYKKLVDRVIDSANDLKNSQLLEIPHTAHSFKEHSYINAIVQML